MTTALAALLSDDENDAIADASTAATTRPIRPVGKLLHDEEAENGVVRRSRLQCRAARGRQGRYRPRPIKRNSRNWTANDDAAQNQRRPSLAERPGTQVPLHHVLVGPVAGHRHERPADEAGPEGLSLVKRVRPIDAA